MSESIQAKKLREEAQTSSSKEQQAQRGGVGKPVGTKEGPSALTAAPLLVEIYGGLVQSTRSQGFGADPIFLSFITNLVSWNTKTMSYSIKRHFLNVPSLFRGTSSFT
jgi:hypothetical protein